MKNQNNTELDAEANARLIAAAPQLLAALKTVAAELRLNGDSDPWPFSGESYLPEKFCRLILAAIAAAEYAR